MLSGCSCSGPTLGGRVGGCRRWDQAVGYSHETLTVASIRIVPISEPDPCKAIGTYGTVAVYGTIVCYGIRGVGGASGGDSSQRQPTAATGQPAATLLRLLGRGVGIRTVPSIGGCVPPCWPVTGVCARFVGFLRRLRPITAAFGIRAGVWVGVAGGGRSDRGIWLVCAGCVTSWLPRCVGLTGLGAACSCLWPGSGR